MQPWQEAWESALYGPDGFFSSGRGAPGRDFRTSATAGAPFAEALAVLAAQVDARLGGPSTFDLIEVGAGQGALLLGVFAALPPALAARTRLTAVELAPRPAHLPPPVAWTRELPKGAVGLLLANEWLDNVPCPVVEVDDDGVRRVVLVGADGTEALGSAVDGEDADWLSRWWPDGVRMEVGLARDRAWASARGALARGMAVAIDYAHVGGARPPLGTLAGYRGGRQVPPAPDSSCDITAHVALDSCAAAGDLLLTQRDALRALGVAGARPPLSVAAADPLGYVRALSRASLEGELIDPSGLGAFGWLLSPVDLD